MRDYIEKRIELKAPIARVWRALTDHREFGEWFRVQLEGPFVPGQVPRGLRSMRAGRESRFAFAPQPLDELKAYLERISAQWDQALLRLQALVEED